jgi:O-antigen/teichoic acid export membrane protein/SAM-dependent methyltransferase
MTRVPIRRRLFSGSVQMLLAEGLSMPAGIVAAAYLTRQLGPLGYGLFALSASIIATIEWFVISMLARASIKAAADSDDWRATAVALIQRHVALGLALGLACWAAAGLMARWLDVPALASLLRFSAIQIPIVALGAALLSVLVGRGFYQTRALARAMRWISRLVFILIFVGAGMGVRGAILAGICAAIASGLIAQAVLRVNPFGRAATLSGFWRLALAVFTTVASVRLIERMGLVFLKAFGGTIPEVGFYAAAQNFTHGPGLFALAVAPLLISAIAQAHRAGDEPLARILCRDALRGIVWLLPTAGIAAGAAGEIVSLVYGRGFEDAAPLAQYLVFAGVAFAGLSITGAILAAYDRARWAVVATVPVFPVALAGYFVAVPIWGSVGAAAVTTLASAVGLVGTLIAVHRLLEVTTPRGTIVRATIVTILCWMAAAYWSTPGLMVMVKAGVIATVAVLVIALIGEVTPGEMNLLRTLVPWRRTRGQGHRLEGPPAEYLDPFLADQKRRANLSLIERWVDLGNVGRVLKTDLFDESREGEGFFDAIAAPGRLLVGIDLSPAIAELSVARLARTPVAGVVADVRRVPFASDTFDLIVSNSTLDHFNAASDIDAALAELARVARPGGVVIVTLDNPQNLTYPLLRLASALGATPFPLGETYSMPGLAAALARAGLEVTETRAIIHNPRLMPTTALLVARRLRWLSLQRAVHRVQRILERFEGTRWQYVTGCFVAARAVKPSRPSP